jgi:spermidine synthase
VNRSPVALQAFALFTLSGMAGLVLEAVLLRELAWLFGSSTAATALVLAAFMGGLALGAVLFGRIADRSRRPLALFGLLELGTAVSGAALVWLLGSGRELLVAPLRTISSAPALRASEVVLAFVLVLVPTVLMGGTLPAMGRLLIRELTDFVRSLGWLYGLNTLGGAAGVFLAGFFLFEWVGITASAYLAAVVQGGVGLIALLIDRTSPESVARRSPVDRRAAPRRSSIGGRERLACLIAACVGGGAVLGYEVIWTRLLSLMMRSYSYSFSLMLALFLVGLCIGSILLTVWVRDRLRPAAAVGWLQLAMGLYVAASLLWLPGVLAPVTGGGFSGFVLGSLLRAAPVVLPPTILSGMVLPLAARGFTRHAGNVARDVGFVYALNTAGAIAGSLLAGLVLLPTLGAPGSLVVLAIVNAAAGTAAVFLSSSRTLARASAVALLLLCAIPLSLSGERFVEAFLRATRSFDRIGEVLFFRESATDTIAIVTKNYGIYDPEAKSLITNGVAMSATVKPIWRYMALEGHLPVLFSARSERALAVGVGTGITLSAIVSHPEVAAIDAIELSPGVAEGLDYFAAENGRAHEDPRVTLRVEDGRHHLELSDATYDIVTIEPPPPIVAGAVHLYSYDFYRLLSRRLRAGGVVAQWLPLHAQSLFSARMTARTFLDAFPYVMLALPSARDAVMIGSMEPLELDLDRLFAAYAEPRTRDNLDRAYLETPEALLATILLGREGLARWAGDVPRITDEHPRMEFFRNQGRNMRDPDWGPLLDIPPDDWDWIVGIDRDPTLLASVRRENRALRSYLRGKSAEDPRLATEAATVSRGTEFFLYGFGCASAQASALRERGADVATLRALAARCGPFRRYATQSP